MAIEMFDTYYNLSASAILEGVRSAYEGSELWDKIVLGQSSTEEIMSAYNNIPGVQKVYAVDGKTILGIDWSTGINVTKNANVNNIMGSVNSNAQAATYGATKSVVVDIPSNTTVIQPDPQLDPEYGVASGPLSGSGNPIAAIADKASLAVAGVSIGAKLGKAIDQTLYNLAPDWWDEHLPTINPATWETLVGVNPAGDFFLRTFLGVNGTNDTATSYYNELAFAYYYQMLRDNGAFNTDSTSDYTGSTTGFPQPTIKTAKISIGGFMFVDNSLSQTGIVTTSPSNVYIYFYVNGNVGWCVYVANQPFSVTTEYYNSAGVKVSTITNQYAYTGQTVNGTTYYGRYDTFYYSHYSFSGIVLNSPFINNNSDAGKKQTATVILDGVIIGPTQGISNLPNSTQYPPTSITGSTPQQVLQQLKQQYPTLFDDAITIQTLQDDGTIREDTYIPVPTPDIDSLDMNKPISGDVTQDNTDISDETLTKIFNDKSNKNPTDTDTPDTGTGTGPTVTIPTGNASSLWAVYNPSQSQLNSFGAWLWSSDLVDQIKRLFVDPMQAVIGVHKVFCNVPNGGSASIKCGYIDSGVSAPTVSSQYVQIDCGTVSVNEFYGNVFDYEPYTTIHAYLPFIGVVKLDTGDVMRGNVNITYGVDVITGACLAKIKVTRDGNSGILYSFGGSCAVHYPLSSGSYGGIISGIVSAAVGVGTSVITGNPLAAVGGIVSGAHQAHFDVSKSGGFTGASGATGPKKPYLIISRPQTSMARGFDVMTGYPANQLIQVKDCEGFIKCKETHVESSTATQEELNTIETMLKNGILI